MILVDGKLAALVEVGHGFWLDEIRREYLISGKLKELIEGDGLTGLTTNPSIFQKAITASDLYDQEIRTLAERGMSAEDIFDQLSTSDIQQAADAFLPVYERSDGRDGFVSAEVKPSIAYQTETTVNEALELKERIGRENIFVKVPGTTEGNEAIRRLTSLGVNINITLLFSLAQYEESARSYLRGLRDRLSRGEEIKGVVSVASVFISRVDTAVDSWLEQRMDRASSDERGELERLRGRAAVANARLVYERFRDIFSAPDFGELEQQGALVQRLVWGSTGTKNPDYSDVKYIDSLIGPASINTMPLSTLEAFRDHGVVHTGIEEGLSAARRDLADLKKVGLELDDVHQGLQRDGVVAFEDSYRALISAIEEKRSLFSKAKL